MSDTLNSLQLGERPEGRTLLTASWVVGHKDGSHRLLKTVRLSSKMARSYSSDTDFPARSPGVSISAMLSSAPA